MGWMVSGMKVCLIPLCKVPSPRLEARSFTPSIEEKAAKLGVTLTKNHAFLDGNKRIGAYALLIFLDVNGVAMEYSDADLISLGLGMADGTLDYEDVLGWIHKHKTGELSQPDPT